MFKEHLISLESKSSRRSSRRASCQNSRRHSLAVPEFFVNEPKNTEHVESILVSTGVYNPTNDLMVHLRSLFNSSIDRNNNNECIGENKNKNSNIPIIRTESNNHVNLDKHELRDALSRKNSFISYFDDEENIPDLTVDNLKDAVDHIIRQSRL